ncbi:glycoside hydrolase family 15 protein [Kineosporia babensis]|uniref:Glycoside hydrolase family 15 n=1 Tax=Kineosporia babensis TaxID=499548 RepID=A0A9X1NAS3_9ACTN|nr:hypothetical protein [Kineosporia babensis]MCD5311747.1 hypothetical protein [Kineosporia babensis]
MSVPLLASECPADMDVAQPSEEARPVRRRRRDRPLRLLAVTSVLLVISGLVVWHEQRQEHSENAVLRLMSQVVAIAPDGERILIPPETDPAQVQFHPGTRVLTADSAAVLTRTTVSVDDVARSEELAAQQREWLESGVIPGQGGPYEDMVRTALLDIHTHLLDNGAMLAGWAGPWRYVWPRDASFAAVALAGTGHPDDALRILEFLQRQQPEDGVFEARYRPDEGGVPDDRGKQNDGVGWVLWAAVELLDTLPEAEAEQVLTRLRPTIDASTDALLRLTDGPDALPPHSQDYWEVSMYRLSLGTAAPIALGLRSAAELQERLGARTTARSAAVRAKKLEQSIDVRYGAYGYPRELGGHQRDASVAFLLPPFTAKARKPVVQAWERAALGMSRISGGLAPGVGWRNDGVSWSPQTSLFALTAAAIGDTERATAWMSWLSDHRTAFGSIPEKVLSNGEPAFPAPLTWSDALVVLAAAELPN